MHDFSCFDRKLQSNRPLSIAVDVGLMCHVLLGKRTATLVFLAPKVAFTAAARVLFNPGAPRVAELERTADDAKGEHNHRAYDEDERCN